MRVSCGDGLGLPVSRGSFPATGGLAIELLLALLLGAVVLGAFTGVLVSSVQAVRGIVGRSEVLDAVRTAWVVLEEELHQGIPGRDWALSAPDAFISLRAFRGVARVCPEEARAEHSGFAVAFRGRRAPDPIRDSVLVLGADGRWRAFDLVEVSPANVCVLDPGERGQRWGWAQPDAPPPLLARLFERGELHLVDGALRYRRGGGGRQPLTPEVLGGGSAFRPVPGGVEVLLEVPGDPGSLAPGPFIWTIRGRP